MYYSKYEIIPVLFGVDFFKINCAVPSTKCNFFCQDLQVFSPSLMTPPLQVCAMFVLKTVCLSFSRLLLKSYQALVSLIPGQ